MSSLCVALSAVQLWFFGTYLPHRERDDAPYIDRHRARDVGSNALWSLLSCYHFGGAHWEHHSFPAVPWWRLGRLRALMETKVGS